MRGLLAILAVIGALAAAVAWMLGDTGLAATGVAAPGLAEDAAARPPVEAELSEPERGAPPSASNSAVSAPTPFVARVVDALTDEPVPRASVAVGLEGAAEWSVLQTDEDGRFQLPSLDRLEVSCRVEAEGYLAAAFDASLADASHSGAREVRLQPAAELQVHVVDQFGVFLEDFEAWVFTEPDSDPVDAAYTREREPEPGGYRWTARTDALGVARFAQLPAATPILLEVASSWMHLTLEPGPNEQTFHLDLGLGLVGRVVDQHGREVERMRLGLERDEDGQPFGGGKTDYAKLRDGTFQFDRLEAGDYWLHSEMSEFPALPLLVTITGRQARQPVKFHVWRGPSIAGVVVDPKGVPADARVTVRYAESELDAPDALRRQALDHELFGRDSKNVRSALDGTFEIHGLPPGEYLLEAGDYSHPVKAHTGELDLTLHMGTSQFLRGTIHGASEAATLVISRPDHRFMALSRFGIDEEGAFAVRLEPGPYALFVSEGQDVALHTGMIDAYQEPRPLDVTFNAGAELVLQNDSVSLHHWEIRHEHGALRNGTLGPGDRTAVAVPAVELELRTRRAGEHELVERPFHAPATLLLTD